MLIKYFTNIRVTLIYLHLSKIYRHFYIKVTLWHVTIIYKSIYVIFLINLRIFLTVYQQFSNIWLTLKKQADAQNIDRL